MYCFVPISCLASCRNGVSFFSALGSALLKRFYRFGEIEDVPWIDEDSLVRVSVAGISLRDWLICSCIY